VLRPILPAYVRSIVNGIETRLRLQRELDGEHRFSDEILRTAEAIVLVLGLDGKIIRFNPYFSELTGWEIEELVGKDWIANCIPEPQRDAIREVFETTTHDVRTRGVVNDVCGRDGRRHKIRWSNTILRLGGGSVDSILAIGLDVNELEEAQQRAIRAERLAAIGQAMTALAHESRNALQRIKAASDVLSLEIAGNANAEEEVCAIQRATGELERILEELRSFASPLNVHPSRVALADVWRQAWANLRSNRFGRDALLIESPTIAGLELELDGVRMEQVFRNLFENSLAACDDPVRVLLDARYVGHTVEIRYEDNGPGLNDEQRQRLFEPFFTTKPNGTGLGMAICQRIVEAHRGTMRTEPTAKGACFLIRLPRGKKAAEPLGLLAHTPSLVAD
jgi:PAS domain S-box-containing protein